MMTTGKIGETKLPKNFEKYRRIVRYFGQVTLSYFYLFEDMLND